MFKLFVILQFYNQVCKCVDIAEINEYNPAIAYSFNDHLHLNNVFTVI